MKTAVISIASLGFLLVLAGDPGVPIGPVSSGPHSGVSLAPVSSNDVVQGTCVRCHSDRRLSGNLSLEGYDVDLAAEDAETTERIIRKLQAGMMPPPGARRPGGDTLQALVEELEKRVDDAADDRPRPGGRSFQRLNRAEYGRAIEDLLGLRVDAGSWLPLDQMSANFDNMAAAQALSPTLLDAYLNAASEISRMAIGDGQAPAKDVTYKNPEYVSQHPWDQVEGAPYGTRGGMVVDHVFPADAEYVIQLGFSSGDNSRFDDVDVSIDGERVSLIRFTRVGVGADGRGAQPLLTEPIQVPAGQHRVSAAFIRNSEGPYEDLIRPHDWSMAGGGSGGSGITTLPHLRDISIGGPYNSTGLSQTESRQRVFVCRPTTSAEEGPCARQIFGELASRAYRRPATARDIDGLMTFYEAGVEDGGFEAGVRRGLEAILASPYFVLRLERQPEDVRPGETYRLSDDDLASRLSYFLWGTLPDDELLRVAEKGDLSDDDELERQTRRMLADPRSEALGRRFAAQWLRLQDLYKVRPDPNYYPNFDENVADAMHRETELLFNSLVQEDRSVLDLFRADYTFVNERLADHYGMPGVSGDRFRRVEYTDGLRQGLLGHGSILVLTSLANRTSPVLRGKWVMEVLLGSPPPPPPPGVPDLEETEGSVDGHFLTTRERMELHRKNPSCSSCHKMMDPIGLALDNFDVTGKPRALEFGMPLDTRGDFYDGTPVSTPAELTEALLKRPIPLVRTFTENLMAYALGRRVEYFDQPTIRKIVREAEDEDYSIGKLILGVIESDAFQMRQAADVATQAGSGGLRP